MKFLICGDPRTKKNSQRLIMIAGRPRALPSKAFVEYEKDALKQLVGKPKEPIESPVNVKCVYYMATRRIVDLVGLLQGTDDILVDAKILADDNSRIIRSHDGSTVLYDKENPRAEIWVEDV